MNNLENDIKSKLQNKYVEATVEQLGELDIISDHLKKKIANDVVTPKTLEGLVSAWVKVAQLRFEIRDRVLQLVEPELKLTERTDLESKYDMDALREVAVNFIKEHQKRDRDMRDD